MAAVLVGALSAGAASSANVLKGTVGPGFTITLTSNGKKVGTLKPGAYTVTISDKSNIHNFHLSGPGVNDKTAVTFKGTKTWHVTLKKGSYTYVCDPHKTIMKGKFTVS